MNCRKSILLLIALSMFAGLMACGGGSSNNTTKTIAIAASTGTGYTTPAAVGTAFGTFSATVTSNGTPVSGATVTFTAPTAGAGIATGTFLTNALPSATDTETTGANGVATSTTFSAGTVAGSYNVTATTSGATTPATFAVANAAGAASTISISSGNNQSVTVSTAFTALAVLVVDGDGNPVNNATVTFTIVPGGTGASAAFATTGTTDTETTGVSGVYTTSQTLTANSTAGAFTVTADFTGDNNPVTFNLTNTAAAVLLMQPGNYVFSLGGYDSGADGNPASPYFVAGVFTVNSTGNTISGGELTFSDNNYMTTTPDAITSGTVATTGVAGDTNLLVTINTGDTNIGPGATTAGAGSGTLVLNVALAPENNTRGLISEYDTWASSSGELNLQTPTAALCPNAATTPCGYAFSVTGETYNPYPLAYGGVIVVDGTGTISGTGSVLDLNEGGAVDAAQTITASTVSTPDSLGHLQFALNTPLFTSPGFPSIVLDAYIIDANHIRVVENWNDDDLSGNTGGTMLAQTGTGAFSSGASLSGSNYVIRTFGHENTVSGNLQVAGVLQFQSDGSVTGNISYNDFANISAQGGVALANEATPCVPGPATNPCYTVDTTGRVTITNLTDGSPADKYNLQLYLDGNGHAQVISVDATDVLSGNSTAQKGALTFSGGYALGIGAVTTGGDEVNGDGQVGVTTSIGGYADTNQSLAGGSLNTAKSINATFTAPTTQGIVQATGSGGSTSLFTIYLIDATQGVIIESDNQQLTLGYFSNQ